MVGLFVWNSVEDRLKAVFSCIFVHAKNSLERVRALSAGRVGVFPVTLWRDATRAVFERVRGSSIGHRRLGERVSAEHTRYRIQQKETLKKHFPKKIINFVTVQLW